MNLKVQGQFKFDLYDSGGELLKSSDWVDNFITNSGVMYPSNFAFADCFRFLSIGVGTSPNSIVKNNISYPETTGLSSLLSQYSYIGSRPNWNSGQTYYAQPGNYGAGCGYINNNSGVSLIRQWNLPNNTGGYFTGSQTFTEFMLSPGRPYITGANGQKVCNCNQVTSDLTATGLDCSSTAEYYTWLQSKYATINGATRLQLCDATNAFARVLYNFTVTSGSILTVTYQLNVILDTGVHLTTLNYGRSDSNPNWNHLLNIYNSITQPGICLINNGTINNIFAPNNNIRLQHCDYTNNSRGYSFLYEYGESFIPPFGAPLEPSNVWLANNINNQNVIAYVSTDNLQFLVSSSGGNFINTGNFAPWNFVTTGNLSTIYSYGNIVSSGNNSYQYIYPTPSSGHAFNNTTYWENIGGLNIVYPFSSGVMPFQNNNDISISNNSYWTVNPNMFNIRSNSGTSPDINDITQFDGMSANTFESVITTAPIFILNYLYNNSFSGTRSAQVNYTYNFQQYYNSNTLYVKSLVLAYQDIAYGVNMFGGDNTDTVPFFDSIFSGYSGNANNIFLPVLVSGNTAADGNLGYNISGSSLNGDYNSLTVNSLYPIFNTFLKWQVPCPAGTIGC